MCTLDLVGAVDRRGAREESNEEGGEISTTHMCYTRRRKSTTKRTHSQIGNCPLAILLLVLASSRDNKLCSLSLPKTSVVVVVCFFRGWKWIFPLRRREKMIFSFPHSSSYTHDGGVARTLGECEWLWTVRRRAGEMSGMRKVVFVDMSREGWFCFSAKADNFPFSRRSEMKIWKSSTFLFSPCRNP